MAANHEYDYDSEDLRAVHDLLGVQDSEKNAHTLIVERYAASKNKDPDPQLDVEYILINAEFTWGAQAALAGVIGNAVYDGAKSAVRSFVRRCRRKDNSGLDAGEAEAFALYVVAYLVVRKQVEISLWSNHPPKAVAVAKEGDHWICRFEKSWFTQLREKKSPVRTRKMDAIWKRTIEIRLEAGSPSIPDSHYRMGTELRLATPAEAQSRRRGGIAEIYGGEADRHGLGEKLGTVWKRVGSEMPQGNVDTGGICGV
ncbi:hypothetical protein GCM10022243_56610 [Saccharothrix violaceirubra]